MITTRQARPATPTNEAASSAVVVHSGARDAYQVARALEENGMLEALVTDLFWPADRRWARAISSFMPSGLRSLLGQRSEATIPSSKVYQSFAVGLAAFLSTKLPRVPLSLRRRLMRNADATLGRTAGSLARRKDAGLLSYSYYGHAAFSSYHGAGILFQLHPHPVSMRRILTTELEAYPECALSLRQEWEMSLPEVDFQRLVDETKMASSFLVASSFTRSTLVENGTSRETIKVVPYGVDQLRFKPDASRRPSPGGKLRLLFVGQINQRKGIKYLLEALRLLGTKEVELTVCGRVVDDLKIFQPFADRVTIRPNVSTQELVAAYQSADLFIFPSVAEGFGQVLLESLASGLPILSTTHTAAPDLIESGREGFVVDPRSPDQIADRIEWALTHRDALSSMRHDARVLAEQFTWQRFRTGVASVVRESLELPANFALYQSEREEVVR